MRITRDVRDINAVKASSMRPNEEPVSGYPAGTVFVIWGRNRLHRAKELLGANAARAVCGYEATWFVEEVFEGSPRCRHCWPDVGVGGGGTPHE